MIDRKTFTEGLSRIGIATRQPADAETLAVYHDALEHQADAAAWETFTRAAVASGRFRFFPTVAELVDALHEHQGGGSLEIEAGFAYERVLAAGRYTPSGGATWSYRDVLADVGKAAAGAFMAAGGHSAFVVASDQARRRERFIRAYLSAVRSDPSSRLLPPAEVEPRALPAPAPPSIQEARTVLRRLADLAAPEKATA
jgi:hypothetical protein